MGTKIIFYPFLTTLAESVSADDRVKLTLFFTALCLCFQKLDRSDNIHNESKNWNKITIEKEMFSSSHFIIIKAILIYFIDIYRNYIDIGDESKMKTG